MQLWEIVLAFQNCNGESSIGFKQYLITDEIIELEGEEFETSNCYNYILSDVEKLLTKSILNLLSSDAALQKGLYSWSYVSSYYASHFIFQAINRLHLDFSVYVNSYFNCRYKNYLDQTLIIKRGDKSSDTHQREYSQYYQKVANMKTIPSPDRYWNLACSAFPNGNEVSLRNDINYVLNKNSYNEFELTNIELDRMIGELTSDPFNTRMRSGQVADVAHLSMKYAASRIRSLIFILNKIANGSSIYRSYFQKNIHNRKSKITTFFDDKASEWLVEFLNRILVFNEEITEEVLYEK